MDKQSALESGRNDIISVAPVMAGQEAQKGASAIEYVMIIAVIVIAIALAFTQTGLGDAVSNVFSSMEEQLEVAE